MASLFWLRHIKNFLKLCLEAGSAANIELRYNTNGTVWDEELAASWAHFKSVQIKFSIDGIGPLNDYIRYPSRWDQVLGNLDKARQAANHLPLKISVDCALQALNVFRVPEIVSFFAAKSLYVALRPVTKPEFLSLAVLGPRLAGKAQEILSTVSHHQIAGLQKLLDSSQSHLWEHFLGFSRKLDEQRGQSLKAVAPELLMETTELIRSVST